MTDRNNMQIQSCILDLHTPVLTGPRQVGKTTLLTKMAGEDRKIVSLDNPTIREMAPNEEDAFSGAALLKTTVGTGAVVCMPADVLPIDKKNWYIPAWLI